MLSSCSLSFQVTREDWETGVKENLNAFLKKYKNTEEYAVFDFDNTVSIFDFQEQLIIHQLNVMAFAVNPAELKVILESRLTNCDEDLSSYGYFSKGSYKDLIADIVTSYNNLVYKYGQFTSVGLNSEKQEKIHKENDWKEFSTKMRIMYSLIKDKESSSFAYEWILCWFTGMLENEVYDLAYSSIEFYSNIPTSDVTWNSPDISSKIGKTSITFKSGITITSNINELWTALTSNGIDVWVCSSSSIDVIRAAIDYFELHDSCKGALALSPKLSDEGKYTNQFDYETSYGYYAKPNKIWDKMLTSIKAQTYGEGKVTAINNVILPLYKRGPIAGFMDTTGDYNFCTEYSSLKLVVCFNRADCKVSDGGGLISILAMHQKNNLNYNLETANNNGDTLYLLQGRDENGTRNLINSNGSILLGKTSGQLFANDENKVMYDYFTKNSTSTKDILNKYSIKTTKEASEFGFKYGFLNKYSGYHSI